jgi:hypothetical protein
MGLSVLFNNFVNLLRQPRVYAAAATLDRTVICKYHKCTKKSLRL